MWFIPNEKKLVQFSYESDGSDDKPYINLFNKYCKTFELINVKSIGEYELLEISYYVHLKNKNNTELFIRELKSIPGINYANLLFDEEKF